MLSRALANGLFERRLSQSASHDLVRRVVERVSARPAEVATILAEYVDPLMAFTAHRQIVAVNSAAAQLFGHEPGQLEGCSTDVLVPARMRQPDPPPLPVTDTLTTVELPGVRRDGTETQVSWTFAGFPAEPAPIFVMLVRDRTEIEDALDALYASEQRFRLLVDGVHDHAVIMLDVDGRIATWNTGAERIKGWSTGEIIGQPYETFYPPEDRAAGIPAENLATALRDGHKRVAGWRMRKDGSRFYAEASIWPLFSQDGVHQGFAKITHDLTSERESEEIARRLEVERVAREAAEAGRDRLARLHRVAQALSLATTRDRVVAVVLEHCLHEVNAVGGAVMMLSEDRSTLIMLGQVGHPDSIPITFGRIPMTTATPSTTVVRTGEPAFYECADRMVELYPHLETHIRTGFEATALMPLRTPGSVFGLLAVRYREHHAFTEDERSLLLTMAELCGQALERARLFDAELAARAEAETASRAKDEFLAMLGHELRNPLAPIATAIDLMKLRGETHSVREREIIERQLGHITHLVDDLLDISRITRGKLVLSKRPIELADVVARAVEMASPLLEQRHHHLQIEVPRGLSVVADPARLAQVLSNLLTNAAKYTRPNGQITLVAAAEGDRVVIHVRDNGQGISEELLPHVFDLFTQGKRTFDRSDGGLGIGLALVKNLIALHDGTVGVESTIGVGSVFTLRMPLHARTDVAIEPPPPAVVPTRSKRVLLVDDNRDFAEMLSSSLRELGYDVSIAIDGVSALEQLREFQAEAAVLDLGLPLIDGFELARRIREQFASRIPRLIAVTGYGQQHDRERSAGVGFAAHLVKPIDLQVMIAALERDLAS